MPNNPSARDNLQRKVFASSRLAEFTSIGELTKQTGHSPEDWPLVILKELVDNAVDESKRARLAPEVKITVDNGEISVTDNGSGIAAATVERMLDYTVRVSDGLATTRRPEKRAILTFRKNVLVKPTLLAYLRTIIESGKR